MAMGTSLLTQHNEAAELTHYFEILVQDGSSFKVVVQRFYRPDDISQEQAYKADFWDVYASDETVEVEIGDIVSKCSVLLQESAGAALLILRRIQILPQGKSSMAMLHIRWHDQISTEK